jgi:hypothetical protein
MKKNIFYLYALILISSTLCASEAPTIFESEEVKAIQREFTEFSLLIPDAQQSVYWTREGFPITSYRDLQEDQQARLIALKKKRSQLIEQLFPVIHTLPEYRKRKDALSAYNTTNVIDTLYNEDRDGALEVKTACLAAEKINVDNYSAERRLALIEQMRKGQFRLKRLQHATQTKTTKP